VLGVPPGTLAAAAFEAGRLERSMRGTLTADEWYAEAGAAVAEQHQIDAEEAAMIMAHIGWRIDETVMELIDEVRKQVPVVLLSNASTRLEDDLRLSGIYDRFDAVVGSASLGVIKPEPAAFEKAADVAKAQPERCLMVDDRDENVCGAESTGMRAVRFTDADALASELAAVGVLGPPELLPRR
jgi:putative hydrolase of the HAD superfamily